MRTQTCHPKNHTFLKMTPEQYSVLLHNHIQKLYKLKRDIEAYENFQHINYNFKFLSVKDEKSSLQRASSESTSHVRVGICVPSSALQQLHAGRP